MAEQKKILGQSALPATTLTDVYTVPSGKQAVVSTIFVANRAESSAQFRISVCVGGEANSLKQYIYYDLPIPALETFAATTGITLNAGDVVRGYASNSNLTINLFGVEITT